MKTIYYCRPTETEELSTSAGVRVKSECPIVRCSNIFLPVSRPFRDRRCRRVSFPKIVFPSSRPRVSIAHQNTFRRCASTTAVPIVRDASYRCFMNIELHHESGTVRRRIKLFRSIPRWRRSSRRAAFGDGTRYAFRRTDRKTSYRRHNNASRPRVRGRSRDVTNLFILFINAFTLCARNAFKFFFF